MVGARSIHEGSHGLLLNPFDTGNIDVLSCGGGGGAAPARSAAKRCGWGSRGTTGGAMRSRIWGASAGSCIAGALAVAGLGGGANTLAV